MKNPTILISEGKEVLGKHLKSRLFPKAFNLIECNGIENTVRTLQDHNVDVVISLSTHKSEDETLRITKEIRRHKPTVPIILITKYSSEEMAIAALRAGVNSYIKIPFSEEALLKSIQEHLTQELYRSYHWLHQ